MPLRYVHRALLRMTLILDAIAIGLGWHSSLEPWGVPLLIGGVVSGVVTLAVIWKQSW